MVKRGFDPSRRAFLKYSGKVAANAAVGGILGGFIGKGYEIGKMFTVKEKTKKNIGNFLKGYRWGEGPSGDSKDKPISIKSFLYLPFRLLHEYPVSGGSVVGATYRGVRSSISSREKYNQEKYQASLARSLDELHKKLDILMENHPGADQQSKLEQLVEKPKASETLVIGFIGILTFISLESFKPTGFFVKENITKSNLFPVLIIIISLILLVGYLLKRRRSLR